MHSEDFAERAELTRPVVRVHSEDFAERAELTRPVVPVHSEDFAERPLTQPVVRACTQHRHTAVTATPLVGWVTRTA